MTAMQTTTQTAAKTKPVSATNPFARRRVGKREWKVTVTELLESERTGLRHLRSISDRFVSNSEVQRLTTMAAIEAAERMSKLYELLSYGEAKEPDAGENESAGETNGNGDGE
jgi:hypothetical protein